MQNFITKRSQRDLSGPQRFAGADRVRRPGGRAKYPRRDFRQRPQGRIENRHLRRHRQLQGGRHRGPSDGRSAARTGQRDPAALLPGQREHRASRAGLSRHAAEGIPQDRHPLVRSVFRHDSRRVADQGHAGPQQVQERGQRPLRGLRAERQRLPGPSSRRNWTGRSALSPSIRTPP